MIDLVLCLYAPQKNTILQVFYILLQISNMTAEIKSHMREVQEITNNSNFLMVPRVLKPLRAGFLHHVDLIVMFFFSVWLE